MKDRKSQVDLEILYDISSTGKVRPWKEKKEANNLLASAYEAIGLIEFKAKAIRLKECATWLEFSVGEDGMKKLHKANFCRVRLCPICGWRRSLKIYGHMRKIVKGIQSEKEYAYIFLSLTVKNCLKEELDSEIDRMMLGWNRFTKYKAFKNVVKGWYRGLEITHNIDIHSESYDTFHPHFHCVLAVNKSYFRSRDYIDHEEWTSLWKKAMRLDYIPQVDVRKAYGNLEKSLAEIAKYAVKDAEYIIPEDFDLTLDTVQILDGVLANRRLVAYGGKFAEWHKKLNLDDELDGDLVNIDGEDLTEEQQRLIYYTWNVGYNQYIKE